MIARLRGTLGHKGAGVVLDVGGVGYEVAVTPQALSELPSVGEEAVLHTHLYVREDTQALFGFTTATERDLFRVLLGASGVGPKVALAILATHGPEDLRRAVSAEDTAALEMVPGIGKRTAQKLILELRPRLELPDGDLPGGAATEVREAREGLGFAPAGIREAMAEVPATDSTEQLLAAALQVLGKR